MMSKDIKRIFQIEFILLVVLALCTFFHLTNNRWIMTIIMLVVAIGISLLLKRERVLKIDKKKIIIIVTIFALLYVGLFYMIGIYSGFYEQRIKFGWNTILNYIIPISVMIVSMEFIRDKLLLNKGLLSYILIAAIGSLADIAIYIDMYSSSTLNSFLAVLGLIIFASIANNILYTYISIKYGKTPVIVYRLITTLYVYIVPIAPDIYVYFRSFIRMLYPLLIYSYLDKYFNTDVEKKYRKDIRKDMISMGVSSTATILLIALISCKYTYGIIVIGSESMTGTIDKGDAIIFKNVKGDIKEGDVIVYQKEDVRIVHRVKDVKYVNDEFRYYTQGDANIKADEGYVTSDNLVGKVLIKIKYIGKPSLWLRSTFE